MKAPLGRLQTQTPAYLTSRSSAFAVEQRVVQARAPDGPDVRRSACSLTSGHIACCGLRPDQGVRRDTPPRPPWPAARGRRRLGRPGGLVGGASYTACPIRRRATDDSDTLRITGTMSLRHRQGVESWGDVLTRTYRPGTHTDEGFLLDDVTEPLSTPDSTVCRPVWRRGHCAPSCARRSSAPAQRSCLDRRPRATDRQ